MSSIKPADWRGPNASQALTLFMVVFGCYIYFCNAIYNPNVTPRIGLALSLIYYHKVMIDDSAPLTVDKSYYQGHYYLDKAPGMSFLAVPAVYVATWLISSGEPGWQPAYNVQSGKPFPEEYGFIVYTATIFASSLPAALAVAVFCAVLARLTGSRSAGLFGAVCYGLATPAWGWATTLFSHATSTAFLVLGFAAVLQGSRLLGRRTALWWSFLAGLLLGWAAVVEFTAAIPAAMIGLFDLVEAGRQGQARLIPRLALTACAGGLISLTPLFIYNSVAFDSPFALGYSHVVGWDGMKQGFFGFRYPNLAVLYEITFGTYRGLLWISPILLLAPLGLPLMWRDRQRPLLVLVIAIIGYYCLLNAAYFYWDGNFSTGPRHVTPMLPFLCIPLAYLWRDSSGRAMRIGLLTLLGLSIGLSFVCTATDMTSPDLTSNPFPRPEYAFPLVKYLLPQFLSGEVRGVVLHRLVPGWVSILLFLAIGCVILGVWVRHNATQVTAGRVPPLA